MQPIVATPATLPRPTQPQAARQSLVALAWAWVWKPVLALVLVWARALMLGWAPEPAEPPQRLAQ